MLIQSDLHEAWLVLLSGSWLIVVGDAEHSWPWLFGDIGRTHHGETNMFYQLARLVFCDGQVKWTNLYRICAAFPVKRGRRLLCVWVIDWESSDAPVKCCMPISSKVLKQNELSIDGGSNFFRPSTGNSFCFRWSWPLISNISNPFDMKIIIEHHFYQWDDFLYSGHQCRSTSPFKATITRTSCNSKIVGLSGNAMGSNDYGG